MCRVGQNSCENRTPMLALTQHRWLPARTGADRTSVALFLAEDHPGFWEVRGYHNHADPWTQERYSFQEDPED